VIIAGHWEGQDSRHAGRGARGHPWKIITQPAARAFVNKEWHADGRPSRKHQGALLCSCLAEQQIMETLDKALSTDPRRGEPHVGGPHPCKAQTAWEPRQSPAGPVLPWPENNTVPTTSDWPAQDRI
jgi:hypothetical protein